MCVSVYPATPSAAATGLIRGALLRYEIQAAADGRYSLCHPATGLIRGALLRYGIQAAADGGGLLVPPWRMQAV